MICKKCGSEMEQVEKSSPYIAPTEKYPDGLYSIWYVWKCPNCKEEE